jgi:predicted permease
MREPSPPRLAEAVLLRLLPERDRGPIVGDLAEEYRRRVGTEGESAARRWYRGQLRRAVVPAMRRRFSGAATPSRGGRTMGEGVGVSWLDVKLGLRMLRKRPLMTGAALFALSVGIPASMLPGHVIRVLDAPLPEDSGDRIRAVRYWDQTLSREHAPTYFELARWRDELTTFGRLGAYREAVYNLRSGGGQAAPVRGAEVTASTFGLLGAVPALGRTLGEGDERRGAPDVVVVGYDLWQGRLAGDPAVVGSTLQLGGARYTVVGVMPESFRFPTLQQVWLPLRDESPALPGDGRALQIFGRLADGVTDDDAQAEVMAAGARLASDFPDTNQRLVAEVTRFGTTQLGLPRGGWRTLNDSFLLRLLSIILLSVACANVAMLVFAGTATRFRELAIRTSLGASRRRILAQMFGESLLVSLSAAGLGLIALQALALRVQGMLLASETIQFPPYWMDFGLRAPSVLGALGVAVLSAAIAGVLPALKVTGSKVQESIRKAEAGRSGIRFGGVTSGLIVADVAIAVGVAGLAFGTGRQIRETLNADARVGIAAEEYLAVEVSLPEDEAVTDGGGFSQETLVARMADLQLSLTERFQAEPRVRSVAAADRLPRQDHRHRRFDVEGETSWLTVEGQPGAAMPPLLPVAQVDPGFFDALGAEILSGRGFDQADLADSASTVIVNSRFVDVRLGGRSPLGQRIRFWNSGYGGTALAEERWYEIVGVVGPLGMNVTTPAQDAGIYLPAAPGDINPLSLAIHLEGDPATFVPRVREIVASVDPTAVLQPPRVLARVVGANYYFYLGSGAALAVIVGILITLAASGIYAIMSFAVSERTREIGIRRSLGERTAALTLRIGRRAVMQIAIGVTVGIGPAMVLYRLTELGYQAPGATTGLGVALGGGIAVALVIGALACVSPTRRALRIDPSEALRAEG